MRTWYGYPRGSREAVSCFGGNKSILEEEGKIGEITTGDHQHRTTRLVRMPSDDKLLINEVLWDFTCRENYYSWDGWQ